jgi:hypothetical protein
MKYNYYVSRDAQLPAVFLLKLREFDILLNAPRELEEKSTNK